MNQQQAVINRLWAGTVLEELRRFGVQHVCIAPGSRSTPLTLEADANSHLRVHTHFDERGLGFLALGLAKASAKPVAVIVTSGTAVANLLPALAEAKLTGEQLVVLSADRPPELVECGANQAIEQQGIFSTHVCGALNLPVPDVRLSLQWLLSSVDDLLYRQQREGGGVHINFPFPEPLYTPDGSADYQCYQAALLHWQQGAQPYTQQSFPLQEETYSGANWHNQKGLIIVASVSLAQALQAQKLAQVLGWPLMCDPQSGISSDWGHYDLWLQNTRLSAYLSDCEVIVQFGGQIISKRLNAWLQQQVNTHNSEYVYVSSRPRRNNQFHLPQTRISSESVAALLRKFSASSVPNSKHAGWADILRMELQDLQRLIHGNEPSNQLTEITVARNLGHYSEHVDLFLGNSLFVRLVDMFASLDTQQVYTNRGASGIDGLLATAAGVQRHTDRAMLVFIGDLSALYDINSLALFSRTSQPVVIAIMNNNGGAIFDILPVPDDKREALYQMPHGYQFAHAAGLFNLGYCRTQTLVDFQSRVSSHLCGGRGTLVVEVVTPAEQASSQLSHIIENIHAL